MSSVLRRGGIGFQGEGQNTFKVYVYMGNERLVRVNMIALLVGQRRFGTLIRGR